MCGIAGLWSAHGPIDRSGETLESIACRMRDRLRHRGPDDEGVWVDREAGVALAHRRLSILDVSPLGHQPMASADGRWLLVYNGEIYNYRAVAAELEAQGVRLRGGSDTEVLVEALACFGVDETLPRLAGMFAFAAWDRARRRLFLVRDRLGIKGVYYGWWKGQLLFGSELKALEAFPGFAPELDREALTQYLRHAYVPAPRSIWRGVWKLPPGHLLECGEPGPTVEPRAWWSAADAVRRAQADPFRGSPEEAVAELEALLDRVIGEHMISDVPLGAFLSGGIDSSTVVALMQARSARPVRTFTIGFREDAFDEAAHARRVARHLGTEHTELALPAKDAEALIPDLPQHWDEPFADSSQIPTLLVSRLARSAVTVALSGDGGDELFGGYTRYADTPLVWARSARTPAALRRIASFALGALPDLSVEAFDGVGGALRRLRGVERPSSPAYDAYLRATILAQPTFDKLYQFMVSHWPNPSAVVRGGSEPYSVLGDASFAADVHDPVLRMMLLDSVTYLPDDILTKVDRASMAVSLEARVPVLDHRVFDFAWRLPLELRVRGGTGKWPLRAVLERHAPASLFDRPKQGFGVPIVEWLRGSLREWCESLLAEERLRSEGIFEARAVRTAWRRYLGGWPLHPQLWVILMFQAWWDRRPMTGGPA